MVCLWIQATFLSSFFLFFFSGFVCTKSSSIIHAERTKTVVICASRAGCSGPPPRPSPVQTPKSSPEVFASPPPPPPVQTPKSSPEVSASPPTVQTPKSNSKGIPPLLAQSSNDYNPPAGKESRARRNPTQIVIEVAVSVVGFTILCIAITCFLKRKHPPLNPEQRKLDVQKFILHHGSLAPTRYKYSEIKKMTKSFSDKLGQGGYGSVYKGVLPDGRHVAVKLLTETDTNSSGEEFTNEVASISRTSHVNIVTLLGFCHDRNKRAIIYEYMPNKSLDKFLKDSCLDLKQLFRIAVGIARGLEYLHTGCATRIVHFDIKPQNILLDDDLCPKISDFGLARLCKRQQSIISCLGMRGTIGYIAPEVFSRNFGGVSHKSDVYSYGMMLLEMAGARQITHQSIQSSSCENYFPDGIYEQVVGDVVNRKVEEYSMIEKEDEEEARRKMFLVGFWCIQSVPLQRPSISKVVEMLEGSLQSLHIPPKPFLFHLNLPIHDMMSATEETEYSSDQTIEARSQQVQSN